ncbi:hydroxymethylbilane synthase [Oceanibacterium hippocampi]|uniref:Porphobilinogen deaminase n=1 Tax=Oceanibacterium hippocampi TaxID=745714 RepID=A0A1Y5RHX7_9PROT|nr:hydroxymethylbilane synthase [Oceanibacterium hippocampi]SLN15263.1 Porphobilinogen deaminase [Oceanibacterium hippocampi]
MLLKIGTRGSPLALAQANETRRRLLDAHGPALDPETVEIVVIKTSGDRIQDRALRDAGGKGLFIKELEDALFSGAIDIAVHSMKDMETALPDRLVIDCLLPREDPRDALVSPHATTLAALPAGSRIGTASLRRTAQLLHRYPELRPVLLRGNVQSRLRKMSEGVAEATFLAIAGLNRLGMSSVASAVLEPEEMLPAVAQGAIGIERRRDDERVAALLAPLHHVPTGQRVACERAMLAELDGSCHTPIAGLAEIAGPTIRLRAAVMTPDGSERLDAEGEATLSDAAALGREIGLELKGRAGPHFFSANGD